MKTAACLGLALLIGSSAIAQQFAYTKVKDMSSPNTVEVQDIGDFIRLARENRIRDIFMDDSYFLFPLDAFLYQFPRERYSTLEDYVAGTKGKFADGRLYYLAQANKLRTQEEVSYFDSEYFISGDDYRKALAQGFVGKGGEEKSKVVHGLVRRKDLEQNGRILWWVSNSLLRPKSSYSPEDIPPTVDVDKIAEWASGKIEKVVDDIYLIQLSLDESARPIFAKKDAQGKKDLTKSDAVLYYFSKLARFDTYADYMARSREEGLSVKGSREILDSMKMKSVAELQQARAMRFVDGDEFRLAQAYGLKSKEDYEGLKAMIKKLEDFRTKYELQNNAQVLIVYKLFGLPPSTPIAIDKFVEKTNAELASDAQLTALHLPRIDLRAVESLLASNKGLAKYISYSPDTKVLILKP